MLLWESCITSCDHVSVLYTICSDIQPLAHGGTLLLFLFCVLKIILFFGTLSWSQYLGDMLWVCWSKCLKWECSNCHYFNFPFFGVFFLQLGDPSIFPAVIVEHVPSGDLLNNYSGLTCVDEPSDMITENSLDVAEEQIIEDDDIPLTGSQYNFLSAVLLQQGGCGWQRGKAEWQKWIRNKVITILNAVNPVLQHGEDGINSSTRWLAIPAAQLVQWPVIHQYRLR